MKKRKGNFDLAAAKRAVSQSQIIQPREMFEIESNIVSPKTEWAKKMFQFPDVDRTKIASRLFGSTENYANKCDTQLIWCAAIVVCRLTLSIWWFLCRLRHFKPKQRKSRNENRKLQRDDIASTPFALNDIQLLNTMTSRHDLRCLCTSECAANV